MHLPFSALQTRLPAICGFPKIKNKCEKTILHDHYNTVILLHPPGLNILQKQDARIFFFSNNIEFAKNILKNIFASCLDNNYETKSDPLKIIALLKHNFHLKINLSFLCIKRK